MTSFLLFEMPNWGSSEIWLSLLTLTFLEIVLGVDNILFISISAEKLPESQQKKAAQIGLLLAMLLRILLLFGISWLIAMTAPWISFEFSQLKGAFSGQSLILVGGGLFLLYKAVTEIHHKLEGDDSNGGNGKMKSLSAVILEITLINIVFSFDSILTAVGMTNGLYGALLIMIIAVIVSVIIMMLFTIPISKFVNKHPTIQMLGLSFLILVGFTLIAEGAHLAHFEVAGQQVGAIPKGYLYFAIAFALLVEFLNLRMRKKSRPVQLHGASEQAKKQGLID